MVLILDGNSSIYDITRKKVYKVIFKNNSRSTVEEVMSGARAVPFYWL